MARWSRLDVYGEMLATGVVPVFSHADAEVAFGIVRAVAAGGCRVVEFTNRGDHAVEVFSELERACRRELPDVILGAGSVLDAPTAAHYLNVGASFVVGPALVPEVARVCNRRKVAYLPGCATVTEISYAEELGCEIVKLFPGGTVGGPAFVAAVLAPSPWTRIMPTGGVDATEASMGAWFRAGAACVGMGSKLIPADAVAAGDLDAITTKVRAAVEIVAHQRAETEG